MGLKDIHSCFVTGAWLYFLKTGAAELAWAGTPGSVAMGAIVLYSKDLVVDSSGLIRLFYLYSWGK